MADVLSSSASQRQLMADVLSSSAWQRQLIEIDFVNVELGYKKSDGSECDSCRLPILRTRFGPLTNPSFLGSPGSHRPQWLWYLAVYGSHTSPCWTGWSFVTTRWLLGHVAMTDYLLTPAADIQRAVPAVTQVLYADDRSFACATLLLLRLFVMFWTCGSPGVNVSAWGRTWRSNSFIIQILGYTFQAAKSRKASGSEKKRVTKADTKAFRVKCLPGSLNRKIGLGQYTVLATISYGWLFRSPSKDDIRPFDAACSSPDIFRLFRSHFWDVRYMAVQTTVSILLRYAARTGRSLPVIRPHTGG